MKLIPLNDWVVVTPFEATIEEDGIIGSQSKLVPQTGKVLAVGPGKPGIPMVVNEGDTVYFGAFSNHSTTFRDEKYVFVHQSDIIVYHQN